MSTTSIIDLGRRRALGSIARASGLVLAAGTLGSITRARAHPVDDEARPPIDPARVGRVGLEDAPYGRFPVLQGLTTGRSTQLSVVHRLDERLELDLVADGGPTTTIAPTTVRTSSRSSSAWAVTRVRFTGIAPGIDYRLRIHGADGERLDERRLRALDTRTRPARVAVVSCASDAHVEHQALAWRSLIDRGPDLVFFIGDQVYANHSRTIGEPDDARVWRRYVEVFSQYFYYRMPRLIPTLATWDDHDTGHNNAFRSSPGIAEAAQVLRDFFPQEDFGEPEFASGPGVSSFFSAFGQRFCLLDGRTFRTEGGTAGTAETHWGEAQERLVGSALETTRGGPLWLMNGSQYFGGYMKFTVESFEQNHPGKLRELMLRMRASPAAGILVSGDRHLSELMTLSGDVGYRSYEITSSGIFQQPPPPGSWWLSPNPRQLEGTLQNGFVILDLSPIDDTTVSMLSQAWGRPGQLHFERRLDVDRNAL